MNYVFSDIHGCGDELDRLIKKIKRKDSEPTFYAVGDLFDRGPKGDDVWRLIHQNNIKAVLGNHERKLLQHITGVIDKVPTHYTEALLRLQNYGVTQIELIDYLTNLPLLIELNCNTVLVHGGVCIDDPWRVNQDANVYGHVVIGDKVTRADKADEQWYDLYTGNTLVVYGHTSQDDCTPRIRYNQRSNTSSIGIDTAAVNGGYLTAYCVETEQCIRVKSNVDWKKSNEA